MNFSELKTRCERAHVSALKVAEEIGLSYEGLKKGIMNGSLAIRYVVPLCNSLGISPNELLGVLDSKTGNSQVQNGGIGNVQNMDASTAILKEQLRIKDEQINKLLNIMSK